jgi:hypothetical protein
MSIMEARIQERRVIPTVWTRKGGVQRGLERGKMWDSRAGVGRMRRSDVMVRRV